MVESDRRPAGSEQSNPARRLQQVEVVAAIAGFVGSRVIAIRDIDPDLPVLESLAFGLWFTLTALALGLRGWSQQEA